MDKVEKLFEQALKEMFRRVGLQYPNEEFTKDSQWYTKRTWTKEEEKEFCSWLAEKVKKTWPYMTKKKVGAEVAMFNLCYGWKIRVPNSAKCRKCGDVIESKTRHDFQTCKCGAISVDGGRDYMKRSGNPEDFEDIPLSNKASKKDKQIKK